MEKNINLKEDLNKFGDLSKYKFILNETEIFILDEVRKQFDEGEEKINFDYISNLAFILYKTHKKIDPTLLARLFYLAYDKIKNIHNRLGNKNLSNFTLIDALGFEPNSKSIKFIEYLHICNSGKINVITNELSEFIIKYRLGTVDSEGNINYNFLFRLCYELGYTNKELTIERVNDIIFHVNDRLWEVHWLDYGLDVINKRRK